MTGDTEGPEAHSIPSEDAAEEVTTRAWEAPGEQVILPPGEEKRLTLDKLERLRGTGVNRAHNRFIVDLENKEVWVPSWVREMHVLPGEARVVDADDQVDPEVEP